MNAFELELARARQEEFERRIRPPRSCGCIGPQNGDPRCLCKMRGMTIVNGRHIEVIDHGPVK